MDHLAHFVLAGDDDAMIVGGLLGDFWRGAPDPAWPPALAAGVRLHRRVDVHTDAHASVRAVRAQFAPPLRRYAGIVLDVWFDHLLAREFARHTGASLRQFADRVHTALVGDGQTLPLGYRAFVARLIRNDTLVAYVDRDTLQRVFAAISQRLARDNPVAEALPVLEALEAPLQRAFEALWPDLVAFAAAERRRLA